MIIQALDYKFRESYNFAPIAISQNSGFFQESPEQTPAGILMSAEITAYVPVIDDDKNTLVNILTHRPGIYRVKDTSGHYHEIGSDAEPATLTATKKIGPMPGTAYGWDIKISCFSVAGSKMSSFTN